MGGEVIVPSFTFAATPHSLVRHGVTWEIDSTGVLLAPLEQGAVSDVPLLSGASFEDLPEGARISAETVRRGLSWVAVLFLLSRPADPLFSEGFEDDQLLKRGWYDGAKFRIADKDARAGAGCIEYHWSAGGSTPDSSSGMRHPSSRPRRSACAPTSGSRKTGAGRAGLTTPT